MLDPAIREATASELLTLDEEHAMQRSWRHDADKLTFIACTAPGSTSSSSPIHARHHDSPAAMIGDVNLFLTPSDDDDDESDLPNHIVGEVELMIARPAHQNRGYGSAVLAAFLTYIRRHVDGILAEYGAGAPGKVAPQLKHLRVKIGQDNARSLRLFERAGFVAVGGGKPNYFGEVELRRGLVVDGEEDVVEEVGYEVVED